MKILNNLILIESQYDRLIVTDWTKVFDKKILVSPYKFCPEIYSYKNLGGKFIFEELALCMLKLLTFP